MCRLAAAVGILAFLLWMPAALYAATPLPPDPSGGFTPPPIESINPCPLGSIIPCPNGGAAAAAIFGEQVVFRALRVGFIAVSIIMFAAYALRLILENDDQNTVTEVKKAYGHAMTGMAFVSIATFIVQAFGSAATATLINPAPVETALGNVIGLLKLLTSAAVTVHIVMQAIRIIVLQGQESEMEQQKKRLFHGLLGVGILLLSNAIVSAIMPGANSPILAEEIRGIINFLLELLGALSIFALVGAGAFLIFSVDDSGKDRAKNIVKTTVVVLAVVLSSYALVNFFLNL